MKKAWTGLLRLTAACAAVALIAGCASSPVKHRSAKKDYGVKPSPRVVEGLGPIDASQSRRGYYMVGKPYTVDGRQYTPRDDASYSASGTASWYGDDFHGRLTANGEVYDMHDITAAHPTMPLPSYARVTNMRNGNSIIVRVNDRGPYHSNRVMDVSRRAAELLDFKRDGLGQVRVEYLGRASLEANDQPMLMASLRTDGSEAPRPGRGAPVMVAEAAPPMPVLRTSYTAEPDLAGTGLLPERPVLRSAGPVAAGALVPMPPERLLDLGTIPNADTPVPGRTARKGFEPAPARSAALAPNEQDRLTVADMFRSDAPTGALTFASLGPGPDSAPVFVDAGLFRDRHAAEDLVGRLSAAAATQITPVVTQGETLWHVQAGPFARRDDADLASRLAREAGSETARIIN